MTVQNFMCFGTFDKNNPVWPTQADLFASAIRQCITDLTGLNATVSQRGAINTGQGVKNAVRAQVKAPAGATPDDDKQIGSRLANIVQTGTLRACVNSTLASRTGQASAMIDFTTSLDMAIAQNPPGLVVLAPPPSTIALNLLTKPCPSGNLGFKLIPSAQIPDGSKGGLTIDVDQFLFGAFAATFQTLVISDQPSGGLCDGVWPTTPLPGKWTHKTTYVIGADTFVLTADQLAGTVEVTKNGTPVGFLFGNAPSGLIFIGSSALNFLNGSTVAVQGEISLQGSLDALGKFFFEQTANTAIFTGAVRQEFTVLNDTGSPWAAGTPLPAELNVFGQAVTEVI